MRIFMPAALFIVLVSLCLVWQKQSHSAAAAVSPLGLNQAGSSNDVTSFGAKCDATSIGDASMEAGSNILSSPKSSFSQADVGKVVAVMGAGAQWSGKGPYEIPSATLFSTIQKVVDRHTVQLADSAQTTVTGTQASWATDDSAAIQTAISHLTSGGQVTFSRLCGVGHAGWQGLSISTPNVTLSGRGTGSGLAVFYTTAGTGTGPVHSVLKSIKTSGLSIKNLEINGNGTRSSLIGLRDVSNSTFEENHLHNTGFSFAIGILSFGGSGNTYSSNTVSHCGRGFWLGNPNPGDAETNSTITRNSVTDNLHSGIGGTLQNSLVDGNTILRNGGSCIPLGSTPEVVYRQVNISHNTCEYNAWHGVQSDTVPGNSGISPSDAMRLMTGAPRDITVTDNVIDHNGSSGIYALYAVNWTIENNKIYDNGDIKAIPGYQADLLRSSASSTSTYGILIARARDVKVLNNEIYSDPGAPKQYFGIFVYVANVPGSVAGITLRGNTINNQRLNGIQLNAGTGTGGSISIGDNHLLDNGGYGLVINRGFSDVTVENNIAKGNAKADYHGDVPVRGRNNTLGKTEGQRISP